MSTNLFEKLLENKPVITDGAWGTQMQEFGLPVGQLPDAWNLAYPDIVEKVAKAYIEAGSRVILTNTFQSNRFTLERFDLADRVAEINRAGAKISKSAAHDSAYVFASIGPSGRMLVTGETTEDQLYDVFLEQAEALKNGGADAVVVETMSDPAEAKAAIRAAKAVGLPVVGSMVFDTGKNKDRTMMGTTVEQAVQALTEAGADAIGANCGQGIEGFIPICERLVAATELPIWIKANAGLPVMKDGLPAYLTTPAQFASHAKTLAEQGASFIGGCCGTSPEFIRELNKALHD